MTLDTRSSMKRSWVTSTRPPSNSARLSSRTSSVGMSRSFVGSSRISRSAGSRIRRAIRMRACSPPDRRPTGSSSCSGRNRKRLAHEATWMLRPRKTTVSPSGESARRSVWSGSRLARCWSKRTSRRPSARSISPASGARVAGEQVEQRRLAAAVRADEADVGAAHDGEVEVADERAAAERLRQSPRDEQLARPAPRGRELDAGGAAGGSRPGVPELLDQAAGLLDASLRLGGARLRAAPQPLDLAAHRVGQRLLVGGLAAQELVAAGEELAVPAVGLEEAVRVGPVQLEHAGGHVLEEVAVVAHDEDGARPIGEDAFQPEDAVHVEVVGGLVHQQDVGRARQLAGDRQALPPAAGQRLDRRAPVREAGAAEGLRDAPGALVLVHRGQRGGDHVLDGAARREDRILRHVADADAAANGAGAAVGAARSRRGS